MANSVFHKADSRGLSHNGWLVSRHTFSFANYYNQERMHFGALRVLNDDIVAAGRGFGTHPHENMEIISIPLVGELEHVDSMNNVASIREGNVQVMSAGTGISHSEYNKNSTKNVRFIQIWLYPNKIGVQPRYDQITIHASDRYNKLNQILSPDPDDEGVWVYQNAWFYLGQFDNGFSTEYQLKSKKNGLYVFNLDGDVKINDQLLNRRDGYGIWDIDHVKIEAVSDAYFLLLEVPMEI